MRTGAQIISYLFHPLMLATYLVILIGYYFPVMLTVNPRNFKIIVGFVFCFTFVLPIVNIIMFRYFGTISSFTMHSREERIIPFIAITIIYIVMVVLFYQKLPIGESFNRLMTIIAALVLTSTIITFFYKVSVHGVATAGWVGILLPLNKAVENNVLVLPTASILVIAGLTMSARLYLNAHTFNEVLTGALVGFSVAFAGMLIMF